MFISMREFLMNVNDRVSLQLYVSFLRYNKFDFSSSSFAELGRQRVG